jgi:transcriptional regulator MraZ
VSFHGVYEHSLDSKDRLTVPAKFRGDLSDGVVLVAGLDPCVWVFPAPGYEGFSQQFIGSSSPLTERGRTLRRHFHGKSQEESLDSANRLRIQKHLVDHAGLEGPSVLVGMSDYFEIWHPDRWAEADAKVQATVVEVAESMGENE